MRRIIHIVVGVLLVGGAIFYALGIMAAKSTDIYYKIPNFQLKGQQLTNWCWVAGLQMVTREITGAEVTQKEIFSKYNDFLFRKNSQRSLRESAIRNLERQIFCTEEGYSNVNRTLTLTEGSSKTTNFIIKYFDDLGFKVTKGVSSGKNKIEKDAFWDTIKTNLLSDSPVIFNATTCVDCPKGFWNGHTIVCTGFLEYENDRMLYIQDPWYPLCDGCNYYLSYDKLWTSFNSKGINVRTDEIYYNLEPKPKNRLRSLLNAIKHNITQITAYLFNRASEEYKEDLVAQNESIEVIRNLASGQIRNKENSRITVVEILNQSTRDIESYFVQIENHDGTLNNFTLAVSKDGNNFFKETTANDCLIKFPIPKEIQSMVLLRNGDEFKAELEIDYNSSSIPPGHYSNFTLETLEKFFLNPNDTSLNVIFKPIFL